MPVSAGLLAAAPSLIQTGAGIVQSIFGGSGARKAQRELEQTQTPFYNPNKGIQDYYQEALNRYSASPYASQMYQQAQNMIAQSMATGINALQDRRSALSGIGALVGQGQQAGAQAGVQAEQMRRQDFGTLGRAAEMKAQDDRTAFQYNQLLPYEKRMSILGAKAGGANKMLSAGMQNIFGGLSGAGEILGSRYQYGNNGSGGGGGPYASSIDVGLANTAGRMGSPASDIPWINPGGPSVAADYPSINPNTVPLIH